MIVIKVSEEVADVVMGVLNDYRSPDFYKQEIIDEVRGALARAEEDGEYGVMVTYESKRVSK